MYILLNQVPYCIFLFVCPSLHVTATATLHVFKTRVRFRLGTQARNNQAESGIVHNINLIGKTQAK